MRKASIQEKKVIKKKKVVEEFKLETTPFFLYEVSVCILYLKEHRFETLGCKYIKSEKPLKYKDCEYQDYNKKNPPDHIYIKFIDFIGAPEWFINKK